MVSATLRPSNFQLNCKFLHGMMELVAWRCSIGPAFPSELRLPERVFPVPAAVQECGSQRVAITNSSSRPGRAHIKIPRYRIISFTRKPSFLLLLHNEAFFSPAQRPPGCRSTSPTGSLRTMRRTRLDRNHNLCVWLLLSLQ